MGEAIRSEDTLEILKLIVCGAHPKESDPLTEMPFLHTGAEVGRIDHLEILIQNGADPTCVDSNGVQADAVSFLYLLFFFFKFLNFLVF